MPCVLLFSVYVGSNIHEGRAHNKHASLFFKNKRLLSPAGLKDFFHTSRSLSLSSYLCDFFCQHRRRAAPERADDVFNWLGGCGWNKFIRRVSFPFCSSISLLRAELNNNNNESRNCCARCGRLAMCTGANRIRDLWKMELRVWTFVHLGRPFRWIDRSHCERINCIAIVREMQEKCLVLLHKHLGYTFAKSITEKEIFNINSFKDNAAQLVLEIVIIKLNKKFFLYIFLTKFNFFLIALIKI